MGMSGECGTRLRLCGRESTLSYNLSSVRSAVSRWVLAPPTESYQRVRRTRRRHIISLQTVKPSGVL